MSVDETLMCSFQLLKPAHEPKTLEQPVGVGQGRPKTPPKTSKVYHSILSLKTKFYSSSYSTRL